MDVKTKDLKDKQIANVAALIDKASSAATAGEAMAYSQAACNAANALRTLTDSGTLL